MTLFRDPLMSSRSGFTVSDGLMQMASDAMPPLALKIYIAKHVCWISCVSASSLADKGFHSIANDSRRRRQDG